MQPRWPCKGRAWGRATTPQLIPLGSLAAQTTSPDLSSLVSDLRHSSWFLLMDLNRRIGQSLYYDVYIYTIIMMMILTTKWQTMMIKWWQWWWWWWRLRRLGKMRDKEGWWWPTWNVSVDSNIRVIVEKLTLIVETATGADTRTRWELTSSILYDDYHDQ